MCSEDAHTRTFMWSVPPLKMHSLGSVATFEVSLNSLFTSFRVFRFFSMKSASKSNLFTISSPIAPKSFDSSSIQLELMKTRDILFFSSRDLKKPSMYHLSTFTSILQLNVQKKESLATFCQQKKVYKKVVYKVLSWQQNEKIVCTPDKAPKAIWPVLGLVWGSCEVQSLIIILVSVRLFVHVWHVTHFSAFSPSNQTHDYWLSFEKKTAFLCFNESIVNLVCSWVWVDETKFRHTRFDCLLNGIKIQ